MVVHAFPAAKLLALLVKQISKPIANAVKQGAKSSPVFRKYVCLPPAQFYNWCEVKSKMWLLHLGQPVNITVLNEAASIELGANLLGETVIFIIAAAVLLFEYNRGNKKDAAKEAARKMELQELKNALRDLFIQTEEQGAHIRELTRRLGEIESRKYSSQNPKESAPKKSPPGGASTLPQDSSLDGSDTDKEIINLDMLRENKYEPFKGVVFKALVNVQNNMFFDPYKQREPSIVVVALNHLYQNVYCSNKTF